MPKFLYTVILVAVLAWFLVIYVGMETVPTSFFSAILFLLVLFVAFGVTFSIFAFLYLGRKASLFLNRKILFRKSLKRGFYLSFWLTGTLALKGFNLLTPVIYTLFLALCLLAYQSFRSRRI